MLGTIRRAQRFSQAELAVCAGLSQQEVSLLERGLRKGRPETWRKLAAMLGVTVEALRGNGDGK